MRKTMRVTGLDRTVSQALAPWCAPGAVHDAGKVLLDMASAVALGGDCAADLAVVRAQPQLFGLVASDPTMSRLVATLAADEATTDAVVAALRTAHAQARDRAWARRRPVAGTAGTRDGGQVIIDFDATLLDAYSEKEQASKTYKKGFGFHPLCVFLDHGAAGTGEVLVLDLRRGNAAANCTTDHLAALEEALAQLPAGERDQVLVRADAAGGTKRFLTRITDLGLEYSVGIVGHVGIQAAIAAVPPTAWVEAHRAHPHPAAEPEDGEGPQVVDLTDYIPAPTRKGSAAENQPWPPGMRVVARRERPLPGTDPRLCDVEGWRITCFATNTPTTSTDQDSPGAWSLPDLEARHRQRARAEDRIRCAKDTGLRNLPYRQFNHNRIWLEIVALAADLLAWTQTLAFPTGHPARRWEPKKLRFRILAVAGRIITSGRRHQLRLPIAWPWNDLIDIGYAALTDP